MPGLGLARVIILLRWWQRVTSPPAPINQYIIDHHQGKTQPGERYRSKRTSGSVYKENLARSVLQVEPGDRGDDLLTLKLRQTKRSFGSRAQPLGARPTFTEEKITVDEYELDDTELAEENIMNADDRVMLMLNGGPAFPQEISDQSYLPLGTVKNSLTRLRKRNLVEGDRSSGSSY